MAIVIDEFSGNTPPVSEVIRAIEADADRNVFLIYFNENAIQDKSQYGIKIGIVAHTLIPQGYPVVPFNRPAAKYIETSIAQVPSTLGGFVTDEIFGEDGDGVYTLDSPIDMRDRDGENSVYLRIFMEDERYTTYHNVEGNPVSVGNCAIELPSA
ncbi:hypothetical protein GWD52_07095 [Enterobacteriaceae bacterium 4M9]|nr:hypothetical protein [Enterobacteriaceae bacterium 4M9]